MEIKEGWDAHRRNSGVALYLSNSPSHSSRDSGGSTPVIGRHSVMLSPDSVRRVTPPTTMTAMTRVEENKSQFPTAGGESTGSWAASSVSFDEKKRCSVTDLGSDDGHGLENLVNVCNWVRGGTKVS
jgi:hypothetical protein